MSSFNEVEKKLAAIGSSNLELLSIVLSNTPNKKEKADLLRNMVSSQAVILEEYSSDIWYIRCLVTSPSAGSAYEISLKTATISKVGDDLFSVLSKQEIEILKKS